MVHLKTNEWEENKPMTPEEGTQNEDFDEDAAFDEWESENIPEHLSWEYLTKPLSEEEKKEMEEREWLRQEIADFGHDLPFELLD